MSYNQLRIAKIIQETPDARSFVLEIPADLAEKYRYRAGQFLTFRVPARRRRLQPLLLAVQRPRDRRAAQGDDQARQRRQGLQLVPRRG